jgi:hypothetical protein
MKIIINTIKSIIFPCKHQWKYDKKFKRVCMKCGKQELFVKIIGEFNHYKWVKKCL